MNTMSTMIPMSRMIDAAFGSRCTPRSAAATDGVYAATPRADILEGESEYRIVMDLPGVGNDDLDISLENQILQVKAERKLDVPENFEPRRRERADHTNFSRTFSLSNAVDADRISATLDGGVLQLMLPKSEQSLPRRIEVK